ncbi:MAG: glutamate formimidoyltransferase [Anaerolineaceae bacterium]|nr:glutamate formimidoyltransferase [Anaerolineaceae bacterium]
MSQPLIECIPNFSEARRPEIIEEIKKAIQSVPGAWIIDQHSDLDHNRTVITMIGAPADIEEAAFRAVARASELIDLNQHEGQHPRIGATDVVPFIPIRDSSMLECVEISRRVGKRVGDELGIPVYLYEEAATVPDRKQLENIRRGQFEGLRDEIRHVAERQPDFGPAKLGPAGATAIGARNPLVAFNVYLTSNDINIAKKIAVAVRNSSGGLRYVKALGMLVNGMAQVSMNLTNYQHSPVERVVEMVRREAQRYGVGIHHSELVGLIPQQALIDSARWYLQLDQFKDDQILEMRIGDALNGKQYRSTSGAKNQFLDDLASESPTPGAFSATAHSAAIACALLAMTVRQTAVQTWSDETRNRMISLTEQIEALRSNLSEAEDQIIQHQARIEALPAGVASSPELISSYAEQREHHHQEMLQLIFELTSQCSQLFPMGIKTAENCELDLRYNVASAMSIAHGAFLSSSNLTRTYVQTVKDDQVRRETIQQLDELHQSEQRYTQQLRELFE